MKIFIWLSIAIGCFLISWYCSYEYGKCKYEEGYTDGKSDSIKSLKFINGSIKK